VPPHVARDPRSGPQSSARHPTIIDSMAVSPRSRRPPPLPYPEPTDAATSKRMRANTRRDSAPELALRSELHRRGLRFRVDYPVRTERRLIRPDVTFTKQRIAVFVDGCFWHRCPEHGTQPRVNAAYWTPKLDRNVERDLQVNAALAREGWIVMRYWEHDEPSSVAQQVEWRVRECGTRRTAKSYAEHRPR
jgi:DNA mismatch endonuclease (patch repair protein)